MLLTLTLVSSVPEFFFKKLHFLVLIGWSFRKILFISLAVLSLPCYTGFSLVAVSRGYSSCRVLAGFSLQWLPLLWRLGPRACRFQRLWLSGSRTQAQELWHMALIALRHVGYSQTGDGNPCLLHWQVDSLLFTLCHQGIPGWIFFSQERFMGVSLSVLSRLRHLLVATCNVPRSHFFLSKLSRHCFIVFLHWGCLEMFVSSLIPSLPISAFMGDLPFLPNV